jgi:hypothetical protein
VSGDNMDKNHEVLRILLVTIAAKNGSAAISSHVHLSQANQASRILLNCYQLYSTFQLKDDHMCAQASRWLF